MKSRRQDWAWAGVTLLLLMLLVATPAVGQSGPCEDRDGDGYVAGAGCIEQEDCNDQVAAVHPGAVELCNGRDDDCDGALDEGCPRACATFQLTRDTLIDEGGRRAQIAKADGGWAIVYQDAVPDASHPLCATRLDEFGERVVPITTFETDWPGTPKLVWTGREMTVAWSGDGNKSKELGVFIRRLGAWGQPSTPRLRLTDFWSGVPGFHWNGYEYGLVWIHPPVSSDDGVFLARLDPTGETLDDGRQLSAETYNSNRTTWNGEGYGWVYQRPSEVTGHSEIFFQRVASDGALIGPEKMITDHSSFGAETFAFEPEIVATEPGQGYGIAWNDDRTGVRQAWFALLDADGEVLTPPGEVQVSFALKHIRPEKSLVWNGLEFMLSWVSQDQGSAVMATRISGAGEVLETELLVPGGNSLPRLAWNGQSYGMAFIQNNSYPNGPASVRFGRIDCNCLTDGDEDGVLPCNGGDCDDADPEVAWGRTENCSDGKDNDCDLLADCNDPDCAEPGFAPEETAGLRFEADRETLVWEETPLTDSYDLARGKVGDLRAMASFAWAECLASRIATTSWTDAETPPFGRSFYYLVRGRRPTCLVASWGTPLRNDTLTACP